MNYRNPTYNSSGFVDCEIDHPVYGWIPFTASPEDVEQSGKLLFSEIIASGNIKKYLPPPAYIPTENDVRQERDVLLSKSDWTQLPDAQAALSSTQKLDWLKYRQALRDVPQQLNFPSNVTWPVM